MTGKKFHSDLALGAVILAALLGGCSSDDPEIDTITPTTTELGATVQLRGQRFCQQAGVKSDGTCMNAATITVDFSIDTPVQATVQSYTDSVVVVTVPPSAEVGDSTVYLTSSGKSSNAVDVTIE